jgi:hypothetical protein
MNPTKTRSEVGRSNLSKGKRWMYDFAAWARTCGFPGVEVIAQNGRADIGGLRDWTIECKNTADDGTGRGSTLGTAMNQVHRDQAERGTRWHVLAKKRNGFTAGGGYAVMTLAQWAELARVLDDCRVQALLDEILEGK